jgi:hypothetical protein
MNIESWYNLAVLDYVLWSCMSGPLSIVLTAILPIVGWFSVKPIYRLRSHIGEIAASLVFYANVYCNNKVAPGDKKDEAERVLRHQASDLKARAYEVPWYTFWALVKVVPKKTKIEQASAVLMALASSVHDGDVIENGKMQKGIEKLLGM